MFKRFIVLLLSVTLLLSPSTALAKGHGEEGGGHDFFSGGHAIGHGGSTIPAPVAIVILVIGIIITILVKIFRQSDD